MLQFASVELAESRDFVIAACGVNASAFPFVSEDLRADHGLGTRVPKSSGLREVMSLENCKVHIKKGKTVADPIIKTYA